MESQVEKKRKYLKEIYSFSRNFDVAEMVGKIILKSDGTEKTSFRPDGAAYHNVIWSTVSNAVQPSISGKFTTVILTDLSSTRNANVGLNRTNPKFFFVMDGMFYWLLSTNNKFNENQYKTMMLHTHTQRGTLKSSGIKTLREEEFFVDSVFQQTEKDPTTNSMSAVYLFSLYGSIGTKNRNNTFREFVQNNLDMKFCTFFDSFRYSLYMRNVGTSGYGTVSGVKLQSLHIYTTEANFFPQCYDSYRMSTTRTADEKMDKILKIATVDISKMCNILKSFCSAASEILRVFEKSVKRIKTTKHELSPAKTQQLDSYSNLESSETEQMNFQELKDFFQHDAASSFREYLQKEFSYLATADSLLSAHYQDVFSRNISHGDHSDLGLLYRFYPSDRSESPNDRYPFSSFELDLGYQCVETIRKKMKELFFKKSLSTSTLMDVAVDAAGVDVVKKKILEALTPVFQYDYKDDLKPKFGSGDYVVARYVVKNLDAVSNFFLKCVFDPIIVGRIIAGVFSDDGAFDASANWVVDVKKMISEFMLERWAKIALFSKHVAIIALPIDDSYLLDVTGLDTKSQKFKNHKNLFLNSATETLWDLVLRMVSRVLPQLELWVTKMFENKNQTENAVMICIVRQAIWIAVAHLFQQMSNSHKAVVNASAFVGGEFDVLKQPKDVGAFDFVTAFYYCGINGNGLADMFFRSFFDNFKMNFALAILFLSFSEKAAERLKPNDFFLMLGFLDQKHDLTSDDAIVSWVYALCGLQNPNFKGRKKSKSGNYEKDGDANPMFKSNGVPLNGTAIIKNNWCRQLKGIDTSENIILVGTAQKKITQKISSRNSHPIWLPFDLNLKQIKWGERTESDPRSQYESGDPSRMYFLSPNEITRLVGNEMEPKIKKRYFPNCPACDVIDTSTVYRWNASLTKYPTVGSQGIFLASVATELFLEQNLKKIKFLNELLRGQPQSDDYLERQMHHIAWLCGVVTSSKKSTKLWSDRTDGFPKNSFELENCLQKETDPDSNARFEWHMGDDYSGISSFCSKTNMILKNIKPEQITGSGIALGRYTLWLIVEDNSESEMELTADRLDKIKTDGNFRNAHARVVNSIASHEIELNRFMETVRPIQYEDVYIETFGYKQLKSKSEPDEKKIFKKMRAQRISGKENDVKIIERIDTFDYNSLPKFSLIKICALDVKPESVRCGIRCASGVCETNRSISINGVGNDFTILSDSEKTANELFDLALGGSDREQNDRSVNSGAPPIVSNDAKNELRLYRKSDYLGQFYPSKNKFFEYLTKTAENQQMEQRLQGTYNVIYRSEITFNKNFMLYAVPAGNTLNRLYADLGGYWSQKQLARKIVGEKSIFSKVGFGKNHPMYLTALPHENLFAALFSVKNWLWGDYGRIELKPYYYFLVFNELQKFFYHLETRNQLRNKFGSFVEPFNYPLVYACASDIWNDFVGGKSEYPIDAIGIDFFRVFVDVNREKHHILQNDLAQIKKNADFGSSLEFSKNLASIFTAATYTNALVKFDATNLFKNWKSVNAPTSISNFLNSLGLYDAGNVVAGVDGIGYSSNVTAEIKMLAEKRISDKKNSNSINKLEDPTKNMLSVFLELMSTNYVYALFLLVETQVDRLRYSEAPMVDLLLKLKRILKDLEVKYQETKIYQNTVDLTIEKQTSTEENVGPGDVPYVKEYENSFSAEPGKFEDFEKLVLLFNSNCKKKNLLDSNRVRNATNKDDASMLDGRSESAETKIIYALYRFILPKMPLKNTKASDLKRSIAFVDCFVKPLNAHNIWADICRISIAKIGGFVDFFEKLLESKKYGQPEEVRDSEWLDTLGFWLSEMEGGNNRSTETLRTKSHVLPNPRKIKPLGRNALLMKDFIGAMKMQATNGSAIVFREGVFSKYAFEPAIQKSFLFENWWSENKSGLLDLFDGTWSAVLKRVEKDIFSEIFDFEYKYVRSALASRDPLFDNGVSFGCFSMSDAYQKFIHGNLYGSALSQKEIGAYEWISDATETEESKEILNYFRTAIYLEESNGGKEIYKDSEFMKKMKTKM